MKKKKQNNESTTQKPRIKVIIVVMIVCLAATCSTCVLASNYFADHFLKGTKINGVDCSFLTTAEVNKRFEESFTSEYIEIQFTKNRYQMELKKLGLEFVGIKQIEEFKARQRENLKESREYELQNPVEFNPEMLIKTLASVPELQESNMEEPQDAYIKVGDDGKLEIVKEVPGTVIDFDEAVRFFLENYFYGTKSIDFRIITDSAPMVTENDPDLLREVEEVNNVLSTTIDFELIDGSVYSLNIGTTRNWVTIDEEGHYKVDPENIPAFVEALNEEVENKGETMVFYATDLNRPIALPGNAVLEIDQEAEIKKIKTELLEYEQVSRAPIYKNFIDMNEVKSYVEVDLTRQHVWMYYEGELVVTTDCVTGDVAKKRETPTGVYHLAYKARNRTLKGYKPNGQLEYATPVSYWMPFNGGVGFHDATWRRAFGGEIYKTNGSHGCVNMPFEAAKTMYEYIDKSMLIIVYQS